MRKIIYITAITLLFACESLKAQTVTAQNNYDTVDINTTLDVPAPGVLFNDSSSTDDLALTVTEFSYAGTTYTVGATGISVQGSITMFADGSFTFNPAPGYIGNVPTITYNITNGNDFASASLFLTVEPVSNLLEISAGSCNQGYTENGNYKITYNLKFTNLSNARDFHESSLIENIDLTANLNAIFGNSCVNDVDNVSIITSNVQDFINDPYPREFNNNILNPNFVNATSSSFFNTNGTNNLTLYPRQSVSILFCVTVNPFCNGRPNPTPSGSGIDFDAIFNITSTTDVSTANVLLTDFHSTNAVVVAGLLVPEKEPIVNADGTYDYTNTVTLSNKGNVTANNINFNLGLRDFLDNRITFDQLVVRQISGPPLAINTNYDGDTNTTLLLANNSLAPNEVVVLEIFSLTDLVFPASNILFNQMNVSQTQGGADGFNENTLENRRTFSFVTWSDSLGDHLDRYYPIGSVDQDINSNKLCVCQNLDMAFSFTTRTSVNKIISEINEAPNGILEHRDLTFNITASNTSNVIELVNLQLQDNLNAICSDRIISITQPIILSTSTASVNPIINAGFNGTTDINIFNGTSGLLNANEFVTVQFTVRFYEDCIGVNSATFSAIDPLNNNIQSSGVTSVNVSTDTDGDGVTNFVDIDNDNDTVPDILEYNGLDPFADDDGDLIPNYRDLNFGPDINNDGIIDVFDFDNDGIPNHFDLDSDNDGIFDIVEAGNIDLDPARNGFTNNPTGFNGLDNTVENTDDLSANITFLIPNTDSSGNPDYLDIDSDNDGIVDNIEAQTTANYTAPSGSINENGVDTNYLNGIRLVDTDNDLVFDYVDLNSDNDIRTDIIEGWDFNNDGIPETVRSNSDVDNDGLDDAFDNDDTSLNPTNGQTPTSFPNLDDFDTPERDWREIIAIVVTIDNISVTEGGDLVFTISLVTKNNRSVLIQSASNITLDLTTQNGTSTTSMFEVATAPFDYNPISNTELIIPAFSETIQVIITSLDDDIYELDELFTLNGIITSNNTINTQITGIGTILNDELEPNISLNNATAIEGDNLEYTITLSRPSSRPISVNILTSDNTALSPNDYDTLSTNLIINGTVDPANSNIDSSFSIPTKIDNLNEPDEEFLNVVGTVVSSNVGIQDLTKTGTIIDIDPNPLVVINNAQVTEGEPLIFTISLLNANNEPVQNYLPININLETIDGTTTGNLDYSSLLINTSIPANTFSLTQTIETFDDDLVETQETMQLQVDILSVGVANTTSFVLGDGVIDDNDIPNLFSPNSDGLSDTFVIKRLDGFPNFKMVIMDRWGSEVFNYSNNGRINPTWWDGTYKGNPVIEGVYFYTIDYNDGVTKPLTNFIQLVR